MSGVLSSKNDVPRFLFEWLVQLAIHKQSHKCFSSIQVLCFDIEQECFEHFHCVTWNIKKLCTQGDSVQLMISIASSRTDLSEHGIKKKTTLSV